ncbi:diaminopimelate decarboxylase [Halococcus saccharolyticus]|uniref:Diaminopimelate decarboxylase n=1 Tax=Halococcus saccharolyticus DSM 5350 TaxID=1227455 RepID=M0MGW3_9EURY|nr:diaminopimelate decarboxylase [Halococcus saccharolyticus]EMA44962.1 diaminopimelate decarboxylase [Halococcus saccharolyticus DSM 5350]
MTTEVASAPSVTAANPPVRRLADWPAADLRDLAAEHGTPLYVLDHDRIRENGARLRQAFSDAEISYAVKANAIGSVLETIADTGLGAECASAGEVVRALDAGFDRVRYTAVNPPGRDLDRVVGLAADHDIAITVGASDTLDRLAERGWAGELFVRVNPGVGAGHHEKVRTGTDPKFGVPGERVAAVVSKATERGFDVRGLHAHAGSGILDTDDLDAHRALVARVVELVDEVAGTDVALDAVNVGGGFGVPYRETESPLDLATLAAAIHEALGDRDPALGIEPGRYLVADAGVLVTRVNTVKPTPETTVVGVDAGMTDLLRPALYDAHHAIRSLVSDADERETVSTTVVGPVCESADALARDRELPAPARDDLLAVGNAGAYGYEMASTYNSRPRPAVIALDDGESRVSARRETIDDLTRLEADR